MNGANALTKQHFTSELQRELDSTHGTHIHSIYINICIVDNKSTHFIRRQNNTDLNDDESEVTVVFGDSITLIYFFCWAQLFFDAKQKYIYKRTTIRHIRTVISVSFTFSFTLFCVSAPSSSSSIIRSGFCCEQPLEFRFPVSNAFHVTSI